MGEDKKAIVVYSSRPATGNSKKVAEAVAAALACEVYPADEAPEPGKFDFVVLGGGVYRGWVDGDLRAYARKCRRQDVGLFITLGAWPDSDHAKSCMGRFEGLVDSCRVRSRFVCHGRLDPASVERAKTRSPGSPHSWDAERAARVAAAESHPDAADLANAAAIFQAGWEKVLADSAGGKKTVKRALALAAFGSTREAGAMAYQTAEKAFAVVRPGVELRWGYTSSMVRRELRGRGVDVKSPGGVLNDLVIDGYTHVELAPLLMVAGAEYHKLANEAAAFHNAAAGFRELRVGKPLLTSRRSLIEVVDAVVAELPPERRPDDAVLFMGHGNHHGNCDSQYVAAAFELNARDRHIFLATVEGEPNFEEALGKIRAAGVSKVFLVPFMLVAGEHAMEDMAGDSPDSWASRLKAEGFEPVPIMRGMLESERVAAIFAARMQN